MISHDATQTSAAFFAIQPYGGGPEPANSGRTYIAARPTRTIKTATMKVLMSINACATITFAI